MSVDSIHQKAHLLELDRFLAALAQDVRDRIASDTDQLYAEAVRSKEQQAAAKSKPFKGVSPQQAGRMRADIRRELVEAEVGTVLKACGFEGEWEVVRFRQAGRGYPYEDYTFELDTDYIRFDNDLITERKEGRKTVSEPTPAYDRLCERLGVDQIEKHSWIEHHA